MENDEMVFPFLLKGKNKPYFCVVIFLQSPIPVSRNKKKADDRTRTDNLLITSQLLCQLSHIGTLPFTLSSARLRQALRALHDSNGNRTRVTAVKGRCLNRLTMEPHFLFPVDCSGTPANSAVPTMKKLPE